MKTPIAAAIIIFFVIFLSMQIDNYNRAFLSGYGVLALTSDIFYKVFGELKYIVSNMAFLTADIYYHGGVYLLHEPGHDDEHASCLLEDFRHSPGDSHAHEYIHTHNHEHGEHARPSWNILLSADKAIRITEHRHLAGHEEKEMLPWIYYATRLNPYNELAYAVGGYWLGLRMARPEEAIEYLREGIVNNPESMQIYDSMGRVYYSIAEYDKAAFYLEKAKELGEARHIDKIQKRYFYPLLAQIYRKIGKPDKAAKLYEGLNLPQD